jgi:hypothetical protein
MKTRCKFKVESVKKWSGNYEEIVFDAVHGGTKENESFSSATPSGKLVITVTNPNVIGKFVPGSEVYIDITEATA